MLDVILLSFMWAGLALAWNIAGGYAGLISLGHAAFFGIGAYTSSILTAAGLTPWIGCGSARCCRGVRCDPNVDLRAPSGTVLYSLNACRRRSCADRRFELGQRHWRSGRSNDPADAQRNEYGVWLEDDLRDADANLHGCHYVVTKAIEGSRYGYYLFAIRDDEDAASAAGVNPLMARTGNVHKRLPDGDWRIIIRAVFSFPRPDKCYFARVVFSVRADSGTRRPRNRGRTRLGAFVITPLSELLRSYFGGGAAGLHLAIYGAVLIVVMLYFPGGIAGALERPHGFQRAVRDCAARGQGPDRGFRLAPRRQRRQFLRQEGRTRWPHRSKRCREEYALQPNCGGDPAYRRPHLSSRGAR